VLDSRGNPVTKPRLIDTQSLVSSKDPLALLGMLVLLRFLYSSVCLSFLIRHRFSRAGKMSHIRSLVNKANQKVTGQVGGSRKRDKQRERSADALLPVCATDDQVEEEEVPLKRKRVTVLDKGKQAQIQEVASSRGAPSTEEGLFQLSKVWSHSDRFGPRASLYLGDSELKAIRNLGTAGRARAVTEGVRWCYEGLRGCCLSQQLVYGGGGAS
jgi:hypothetical protein